MVSEGRVLYPAVRYSRPLGILMEALGIKSPSEAPNQLHIHFLFTGDAPFDLQLSLPEPKTLRIVPQHRRSAFARLLRAWWVRYKAATRQDWQDADYSPVVQTYLTSMLSRRLDLLPPPRVSVATDGRSLSLLLGTEPVRLKMLAETVEGRVNREQPLELPLPRPAPWPSPPTQPHDNPEVETLAKFIPEECFYVRFSRFENYIWLRRLLEEYGGDLSRMIMLRGTDSQLNQRVEEQLGLRESALSNILGPQVISDVAMLGRDTYLKEGAAIGILFEAKNKLLGGELKQQRLNRLNELKSAGAEMRDLQIQGKAVSFAFTPDNQMRSFYVVHDKYHLVTKLSANCGTIYRVRCGEAVVGRIGGVSLRPIAHPARRGQYTFHLSFEAFF